MKRRAWGVAASVACAALNVPAQGAESMPPPRVRFDTRLMREAGRVDLSRFERGEGIAPGLHGLDLVRNGEPLGRRMVRFAESPEGSAAACIDASLAHAIGLALASAQRAALEDPARCVVLASLVPGARAGYVAESLALHVTVPQASLVHTPPDAVDPALRDTGISAFRINYALNGLHDDRTAAADTRASARLELGANVARWRWRHRTTHTWASGTSVRSHTLSSTLERDVDAFDAQLTLGDFHTHGVLFDTLGLRGVRLASDDRMLPPSMVRHAPVVRGVANTNARVQVRQGGVLLLDTTVAPGPFALRDVQPLGLGGALDVRVIESDGQVTTFALPYAAMPALLREGRTRFSASAGQWRVPVGSIANNTTDLVFEGTLQRGVHDRVTLQGGTQAAHGYAQALGGVAVSTGAGAFSLDHAQSHWDRGPGNARGHALRLAYAGSVATGTQVDLATWRHGSDGFRSLGEALRRQELGDFVREHTRTDASLRQALGRRAGTMTLGLVERTWRGPLARQRSLRVGWGIALRGGALLQATFDQSLGVDPATTGTVSLSLPLDVGPGPTLLHAHARAIDNQSTVHASASGAFGRDRRHAWGGGVSHAMQSDAGSVTTTSATLSTHGRAGHIGGGISTSPHARQWSATAEGSLLLHPHGATLGMPLGDTIALVRAPHGHGAALLQQSAVRLDREGHAIVPQLSPYRRNSVGVDPGAAARDVLFDWTERSVVPRAGAVLEVVLPTTHAPLRRVRIVRATGEPAPYAAEVRDAQTTTLGTVGRGGIALLRVPAETPQLDVLWQDAGEARRCRINLSSAPALAPDALLEDTPCTE